MNEQDSLLAAYVEANNFEEIKKFLNDRGLIKDDKFLDYKLLIQALRLGYMKIAKLLLENGCRVFCKKKTDIYSTPLYYAVNFNCLEIVKMLLDKGVSIKGKDGNKETPLIFAMKNKYFNIVDLMLTNYKIQNLKINNRDEVEHFHIAIMRNNTKLVKIFLKHGMKVDQISQNKSGNSQGYTPLHFAVEYKSIETVKLLLSNKANFGLKNAQGLTPLHLAFYLKNSKENNEIIDLILSAHLTHLKVMINPVDNNGVSHFHIACSKSNLRLLEFFLKSGVDYNSCIFTHSSILPGYAPLHVAVKYNCIKTIQFLLDNKADVNKAAGMGVTPLHVAVQSDDNIETVKLLLQYNADVCATDTDKNTAIHKALEVAEINEMSQTRKAILNLLFSAHRGNLKNVSNKWRVSLFHIACATSNNTQLIENFLKQNVNINACVKKHVMWAGYSALHFAVMTGNLKVIEILLKNNALKVVGSDKCSLLYWVCKHWFDDTIKAIAFFTVESPKRTLKDEDFNVAILNRLRSIDESRYQTFKLFLKRKEIDDSIMFDVCQIIFNLLQRETDNSQNEIFQLKNNQLIAIFKIIMITLIDHGYDVNKKNKKNESILHCLMQLLRICYSTSIIEMIELLLIRGAKVDIEGENYVTPLMMAASDGFDEVVEILLKYKANPNKCSKAQETPLHFALNSSKRRNTNKIANYILKVACLLLSKGAKVDVKNSRNYTPLHYAAGLASLHKCLLCLLQRKCKIDSKNDLGNTALHEACLNNNLPGVITLLNNGADINLVNNQNCTPLHMMFASFQDLLNFELERMEILCEMLKIFEFHIIKLNCIGFKVCEQNNLVFNKVHSICKVFNGLEPTEEDFTIPDENNIFIDFCKRELARMKSVKIDMYTSLYSIIIKDVHEVSKNVNNGNFKELLNSGELKENFPLYGYILNLQYKKGLKRYSLLKIAKNVLQTLLIHLPDLCYDCILAYFTNQELKRLTN